MSHLLGTAARVATELHVGDVQEPAGLVVIGVGVQESGEFADCALGATGHLVHGGGAQGEDAALLVVEVHTVFLLAQAQVGEGEPLAELALGLGREGLVVVG